MSVKESLFGKTSDGKPVTKLEITNSRGAGVSLINYGATVQSINVPDRDGKLVDVALGYESVAGYETGGDFIGATIGRYANRIKEAKFTVGETEYHLQPNEGKNLLHGGVGGFNRRIFDYRIISGNSVEMSYHSCDGEEGFPGNLDVKIIFALDDENALNIDYYAVSDQDTIVNLTNHAYFNLNGEGRGTILDHILLLNSDCFTEIDGECIPSGRLLPVDDTPFDFRKPKRIGADIDADDPQLACGNGYDHNFVLGSGDACSVWSSETGIKMDVFTTMPGIQFYSGNSMSGTAGKSGTYSKRTGFCLETQYYPDSPSHPEFPSALLKKDIEYHHTTKYKFSLDK